MSPAAPMRVLVCEDSRTYAAALERVLGHDTGIEVVGVYATAEDAIAALPSVRPNLVTMDIELPGMSGLEAVEQIMAAQPLPILVISAHTGGSSQATAAALAAGALEALPKDGLDLRDPNGTAAKALRARVKLLSRVKVIRHPRARLQKRAAPPAPPSAGAREAGAGRSSVIGICASTGGPHALATLLGALPATFPIPILVVQHIMNGFIAGFAHWLDESVAPPVRMAIDGARLTPGVWIAPEDAHLLLARGGRLRVDAETVVGYHRPSADVLLRSLAAQAGSAAVGVVLTGMGKDGAEGIAELRRVGGLTYAQDEASSAIYGMPRAATEQGAVALPLTDIPSVLASLVASRNGRPA